MENQIIQSRTTNQITRSKNLYFLDSIFHYLFRCKQDVKLISLFCYLGYHLQQYLSKKPTLLFNLVIVGFFLRQKKDNHFIYTFNF